MDFALTLNFVLYLSSVFVDLPRAGGQTCYGGILLQSSNCKTFIFDRAQFVNVNSLEGGHWATSIANPFLPR
jgi:hypothetical protein